MHQPTDVSMLVVDILNRYQANNHRIANLSILFVYTAHMHQPTDVSMLVTDGLH